MSYGHRVVLTYIKYPQVPSVTSTCIPYTCGIYLIKVKQLLFVCMMLMEQKTVVITQIDFNLIFSLDKIIVFVIYLMDE